MITNFISPAHKTKTLTRQVSFWYITVYSQEWMHRWECQQSN